MAILLASASPRRREILSLLTSDFEVRPTSADEDFLGVTPGETVLEIASRKAGAAPLDGFEAVLASDTLVYLNGEYFGKPDGHAEAVEMIQKLSGKTHTVYTAVVMKTPGGRCLKKVDEASVTFNSLTQNEIEDYVERYKPFDKAGAYAIQDKILVSAYSGSYTCIMGLPIEVVSQMMDELNIPHNKLDFTKEIRP